MTTRTRNFVIVSLAVLAVGLGSGLAAYYVGFPAGALGRQGGPDELAFVPRNATAIAFANVHEIMTSELRQKVRKALPMQVITAADAVESLVTEGLAPTQARFNS